MCSPGRKGHDDLTSSPPSSSLSLAVSQSSRQMLANKDGGLRSLRDLTQHLTTRADDSHAAPVSEFPKAPIHLWKVLTMSRPGGFFALHRIKPHAPPLVWAPSIHLSFSLATVLPGGLLIALGCATKASKAPTASRHRLRHGLPGYLILFAPMLFRTSVSVLGQMAAFAIGIPPDLYAFHRYTWNSTILSHALANQYRMQFPS